MTKGEAYQNSTLFTGLTKKNGVKVHKLYSYKPIDGTGDFTWARSSTAYRFAQSGILEFMANGVPRVDYTNTCPELLIEKQSTNLVKHSQEIDNADWTKLNSTVTSNSTTAPDGTLTADTLVANSGSGNDRLYGVGSTTVVNGNKYTHSVYAKKKDYDWVILYGLGTQVQWFNINTGTLGNISGTGDAKIENIGNGWYRLSFTVTASSSSGVFYHGPVNANGSLVCTSSGSQGTYVWGSQLEQSEYVTSYIPTGSATVTRVADVAHNNSLDMTANVGTLFIRARVKSSTFDKVDVIATLNDTTDEGYITMYTDENNNLTISTYNNPDQNDYTYALGANGIYNIAVGYDLNLAKINIAVNGVLKRANATTANALVGGVLRIDLGSIYNGISPQIDNRIIGVMWFDTQLSDSDLVAITA